MLTISFMLQILMYSFPNTVSFGEKYLLSFSFATSIFFKLLFISSPQFLYKSIYILYFKYLFSILSSYSISVHTMLLHSFHIMSLYHRQIVSLKIYCNSCTGIRVKRLHIGSNRKTCFEICHRISNGKMQHSSYQLFCSCWRQ